MEIEKLTEAKEVLFQLQLLLDKGILINGKFVSVSVLLNYKPETIMHKQAVQTVLRKLDFEKIGFDYKDIYENIYDFVYKKEGSNIVYYFTDPQIVNAIATTEPEFLSACIMQDNEKNRQCWLFTYYYIGSRNSIYNIGTSDPYPEKEMLLNFWFAPKQLTQEEVLEYFGASQNLRDCLSIGEIVENNGLMFYHLIHNGEKHAAIERKTAEIVSEPYNFIAVAEIYEARGNFNFAIAELGQIVIGEKPHWVYTGVEA